MPTASRSAWMEAWEKDLVPSQAARRSAERVDARTHSVRYYGREATARRLSQAEREFFPSRALPELKIVRRRRPRWGAVVVAVVMASLLLAVSMVVPMLISAATTELESAVGELEARQGEVAASASSLSAQVSALSSPERVAEQAVQLGLVPAQSVHYLQVESGTAAAEGDTTVAGR
jgi:cell division protein FtsL